MGIRCSSPGAPFFCPIHQCVADWLGSTSSGLDCCRIWSFGERELHINIQEVKAVQLALSAILPRVMWESIVLISDNTMVLAYLEKQGEAISQDMHASAGDSQMVGAAHGLHHGQVHTGKEDHSCRPALSPRLGPPQGVISPFPGV